MKINTIVFPLFYLRPGWNLLFMPRKSKLGSLLGSWEAWNSPGKLGSLKVSPGRDPPPGTHQADLDASGRICNYGLRARDKTCSIEHTLEDKLSIVAWHGWWVAGGERRGLHPDWAPRTQKYPKFSQTDCVSSKIVTLFNSPVCPGKISNNFHHRLCDKYEVFIIKHYVQTSMNVFPQKFPQSQPWKAKLSFACHPKGMIGFVVIWTVTSTIHYWLHSAT